MHVHKAGCSCDVLKLWRGLAEEKLDNILQQVRMITFRLNGCTRNDFQSIFSTCIDMLNSLVVVGAVMMCGVDLNIFPDM